MSAVGASVSANAKVAGEGVEEPPPQAKATAGLRRVSLLNLALRSRAVDAAEEGGNPEEEASVKCRTLFCSFGAVCLTYVLRLRLTNL